MGCNSSENRFSSPSSHEINVDPISPSHSSKNNAQKPKNVILVGDTLVGKTSIVNAFKKDSFNVCVPATIVADINFFQFETKDGQVLMRIYDTAGQEKYLSLTVSYFRDSDLALLVFDITDTETYNNLPKWISHIRGLSPNVKIILIGNKIDLESSRAVFTENSEAFAESNNVENFLEVSAKTNDGILDLFESLIELAQ
jgi:small GTP-binding protein